MCADYTPSSNEAMSQHFGLERSLFDFPAEAFPGSMAPIIRPSHASANALECAPACFGMVPHWADMKLARQTYNARSETVAQKPTFRKAWHKRQFCIIPANNFFEPNYETGKPVRWRISHVSERPLGIAGIWEWRPNGPAGLLSFSMLTIHADEHPLMRRFHKPDQEKRMVVILDPQHYHAWLSGGLPDFHEVYRAYPAEELMAQPDPLPPRGQAKRASTEARVVSAQGSFL